MKKYLALFCVYFVSLFAVITNAFAVQPVLLFSDLDSGPNIGNLDTSGGRVAGEHGAIVTVWGKNLGFAQGTSKIYIGGKEAPYVYYWGNALSPANLYVSHAMQKVSFQVHKLSNSNGIHVVTSDGTSNTLAFTVRAGKIYFVDDSNVNSGTGTYADPWKSPASYISKLATGQDGATCYFRSGTYTNTEYGRSATSSKALFYLDSNHSGIAGAPNAFVGYPNEIASFEATAGALKSDPNYFIGIFKDYQSKFWNTGSNKNYNVLHYLTISNLKFVVNTYVASVRNHWRVIGNQCEFDPAGTVFNSGTGLLMYGHKIEETAGAYLKEAKIYGNVLTGDTSKNKLNHAFYLGLGDSPDVGWNYMYNHDIESGPYFSVNSEDCIQRGDGRLQNAKIHDNVIDMIAKPSRALSIHQVPPGSTIYFYNNIIKGGTSPSSPVVNVRSGGVHLYNNTFYNDMSASYTSPMLQFISFLDGTTNYYNDSIDIKNNIFYLTKLGTKTNSFIYIEDNNVIPTATISNNLFFGMPAGSFTGKASAGTNSLIGVDPEFVNAVGGDFHLQGSSLIKDAGASAVSTVVRSDFDGTNLPVGAGYPIGGYEYVVSGGGGGGDTTPPNIPEGLVVQ